MPNFWTLVANVADVYSIYTGVYKIDPDTVWNKPFYLVRQIATNQSTISKWMNSD